MTEDELIAMGGRCELLLQEEWFQLAIQQFDVHCYTHFMSTDPKDKMERESIYQTQQGMRAFIAHLAAYVDQARQTVERNAALSAQDAHIPGID
jgi:hypothetical protein